jgi:hypothetical protein
VDFARLVFFTVSALLIFGYGVAVGVFEIFPYDALRFVADSVREVYAERSNLTGTRPIHFLNRARYPGDGLTRGPSATTAPGLTLISGFFEDTSEIRLLRLDGTVVQRWPARFFDLFPHPEHIRPPGRVPATNWNTDIHGALALPDGSVVFNFEYGGTVKLDRCGAVVWTLPEMTHHSIEPSADGGFWVPGRRYAESESAFPPIPAPYYEDAILKVSADGRVLARISVPEALYRSGLRELLLANGGPELLNGIPDLGHVNDVEELSPDVAPSFPQFATGDLLVSLRNLNLVLVLDPVSGAVKWHQVGPWLRQHDPDFQRDGTITVFNNNSAVATQRDLLGGSNILAVRPGQPGVAVLFGNDPREPMFTHIRGKHQVLEGGNILLTEFAAGRILEVDNAGSVVWELFNRFDEENVAEVSQATRYAETYFSVERWQCD